MQNFDLNEKIGKELPGKTNFSIFLELNCSNFKLKLCERLKLITKIKLSKKISLRGVGRVTSKKMFPETITHKKFETYSSFHVK